MSDPLPISCLAAAARYGALLTIDLDAIAANYRSLRTLADPAVCAAVVKADAYGLGVARVAPALARAGCRDFFVARLDEGIALRAILGPEQRIAVLHGTVAGTELAFVEHRLVPVLNDDGQRAAWQACARSERRPLPAFLQVDTGMARLGFPPDELVRLAADPSAFAGLDLQLVMSHLACADEPEREANAVQRDAFRAVRRSFPTLAGSLAASSGIFIDRSYHADMVRPGAALYGVAPQRGRPNPLRPVVGLRARVIQVRSVPAGTAAGYGHTAATARTSRLATVDIGYADGYLRSASNTGAAWIGDRRLPVLGRVSMDSIILDATDAPPDIAPGQWVDIIGPHHDVDAVARDAGTIGYEVLTSLGPRYHRIYRDNGGATIA